MRPAVLAFTLLIPAVHAQSGSAVHDRLEPFLDRHCTDCHDDAESKGGLDLYSLAYKPNEADNFAIWQHVFDRVEQGEMPPKKKKQPTAEEKQQFLDELKRSLTGVDQKQIETVGRVQGRRLSRVEYEHTLHDLLGIRIPLVDLLAAGESDKSFDTVADAQSISHFHMQKYLETADHALNEAFERIEKKDVKYKRTLSPQELAKRRGGAYRGPQVFKGQAAFWPTRQQFAGRLQSGIFRFE